MFTEFLARGDLLVWPLVALAIFFTVFMGVLVQVLAGWRRPQTLSHVTRLPLASDDGEAPQGSEDESR